MIWLASHLWILMIAALYIAYWVYCIRDFLRWKQWHFDTSPRCPFGTAFSFAIVIHILALFLISLLMFVRSYLR